MKNALTKADWLTAQECLTKGWLALRVPPIQPSDADLFRMEQGREIGLLARELWQIGILASDTETENAAEMTQRLVADRSTVTLFEATFQNDFCTAKADILTREDGFWHVLEVKSSFSDKIQEERLLDDLAYTFMLVEQSGLPVVKASLVLLSREYRYGADYRELFEIVDVTDDIRKRSLEFKTSSKMITNVLFGDDQPSQALSSACRKCKFFKDACLGKNIGRSIFEIPNLHHTKLKRLSEKGIVDLCAIPDDFGLNPTQERVRTAAISGEMFIGQGLRRVLEAIEWSCSYLDFETVSTALPLYPDHGCHRHILTQYSVHHRCEITDTVHHSEYLANATNDCERELTENLIRELGDSGSIIVYSCYEQTRIKRLMEQFPDLAQELQAILNRLVDFLPLIKEHVYHPDFRGSYSIKKVLPVLVPELTYDGLSIANGDAAITCFARMAKGQIIGDDIATARQQLLDYCNLDTFAMVKLHDKLHELVENH